jgi:hypothetical protein
MGLALAMGLSVGLAIRWLLVLGRSSVAGLARCAVLLRRWVLRQRVGRGIRWLLTVWRLLGGLSV